MSFPSSNSHIFSISSDPHIPLLQKSKITAQNRQWQQGESCSQNKNEALNENQKKKNSESETPRYAMQAVKVRNAHND
jgi:hypothetical protein